MDTNTRIIINQNTWERRSNFEFFKTFVNPQYSVTLEVNCTLAFHKSKREKEPFFPKYLYAILRAVNEIPELCYRIEQIEGEDVVVLYKKISVIAPIRINSAGLFSSVNIPYNKKYDKFLKSYLEVVETISKTEAAPFGAENQCANNNSAHDQIVVSASPFLYFTSVTFTQQSKNGSHIPIINVGKAIERNGSMIMPVAICVHHGFCDNFHLSLFFKKIEEYLNEL